MKRYLKLTLFSFLCFPLLCCFCEQEESIPDDDLRGEWEWVKSSGGLTGDTFTPETVGYTQQLFFTSDSMYSYTNDSLTSVVHYQQSYGKSISGEPSAILVLAQGVNYSFQVTSDSLFWNQEAYDGLSSSFVRTRE